MLPVFVILHRPKATPVFHSEADFQHAFTWPEICVRAVSIQN